MPLATSPLATSPLATSETSAPIVVAMSGGVDSCAAALLLCEQGHDVIGVSMQVWDYRKNGGNASRATCCAPADFEDAREIAAARDFPYYVFDFEDSFHSAVIAPFVKSYLNGLTPNPCLNCNRHVKFSELRRRAKTLGATQVATGHYAQVRETKVDCSANLPSAGSLGLFTSVDAGKDQSYFLYAMTQADLRNTLFPVGGMSKPEVRAYLAERGFEVAAKAESQDICFVGGTVGEFIRHEGGVSEMPGEIVDASGRRLGGHNGIYNYTVGQRRGLGVSSANPLYVLNIDPNENTVTVGEKHQLECSEFAVGEVSWISGVAPREPIEVLAKLRYRHRGVRCRVSALEESQGQGDLDRSEVDPSTVRVEFLDQWSAVSPGQAAVFYRTEQESDGVLELLGGGIIARP